MKARTPDAHVSIVRSKHAIKEIIATVAKEYEFEPEDVLGPRRLSALVDARHVAMYLCRVMTPLSLPELGSVFGRDHSTVLYAVRRIANTIETDEEFAGFIKALVTRLSSE